MEEVRVIITPIMEAGLLEVSLVQVGEVGIDMVKVSLIENRLFQVGGGEGKETLLEVD